MTQPKCQNFPNVIEQARAAYRGPPSRLPPAGACNTGQLFWFVRLALDEPTAVRRMHEMTGRLRHSPRLHALLPQVLDDALALTGADFGNVHLLDPVSGSLLLVTQSGFCPQSAARFAVVNDGRFACGRAARNHAQAVVEDVTADPSFTPTLDIAATAGFRAVQATPLADSAGRLVGVVSTHWRRPFRPLDRDLRVLELFGALAGEVIARHLRPPAGSAVPRPADTDGNTPPQQRHDEPGTTLGEVATRAVYRMSAAALSLARAQAMIGDGAAGGHIAIALVDLDQTIRDLGLLALKDANHDNLHRRADPGAG